jgi:phosphonate transport system permease protein
VSRYVAPSIRARQQWLWLGSFALFVGTLLALLRVDLAQAIRQSHYVWDLAREMWPPSFHLVGTNSRVWGTIGETVAMALLGTMLGGVLALGAGLLAASNISPHPAIRVAVRTALSIERAITAFFFLMIFLVAFGLGPAAGTFTIAVSTLGMFGRLFADSLVEVEAAPVEGIAAVGATRFQTVVFGILPQAAPSLVAHSLYAFDVNLRTAVALGVFGAGGLGFDINVANGMLRYRDVLGYTLVTIALLTALERISDAIRRRILPAE